MRWIGHAARMGEQRNAYRILVGMPEGMIPLGRPRHRWKDNVTMDPRGIGWGGMDWIDVAQDKDQWRALANMVKPSKKPAEDLLLVSCLASSSRQSFQTILMSTVYADLHVF
jgi:hypothetical protein